MLLILLLIFICYVYGSPDKGDWFDGKDTCDGTKNSGNINVCVMCNTVVCTISGTNDPWTNQQIGYQYKVTGTTYTATCDNKPNNKPCGINSRRRRLLQDEYGNSGERL